MGLIRGNWTDFIYTHTHRVQRRQSQLQVRLVGARHIFPFTKKKLKNYNPNQEYINPRQQHEKKKTQNKKCLVGHITGNPLGRFAIPLRSPWLRSSWQCWLLCFPILRPLLL